MGRPKKIVEPQEEVKQEVVAKPVRKPRAKKVVAPEPEAKPVDTSSKDLVNALVQAIQLTRPVEKKNSVTRKPGSPWDPTDGSKKLKLKRKMYQHAILIDPDFHTNEEIDLMNRLKVGRFCEGWVKVYKRKDQGIDIDYPVKTASQRLKLFRYANSFKGLLERCIEEAANPKPIDQDDN